VTRLEGPSSFAAAADAPVAASATVVAPTATSVAGATVAVATFAVSANAVSAALSGGDRRAGVEGGARVGDGEGCEDDVQLPGSMISSVGDDGHS